MHASTMTPAAERALERTFERAMGAAGRALGEMSGHQIRVVTTEVARTSSRQVLDVAGGAGTPVVAIYVGMTGSLDGHALLVLRPADARQLASILLDGLGEPGAGPQPGVDQPSLGDLELSALCEVGNVTISSFLNEVGRHFDLPCSPTVPIAVTDMAGAILDAVLADVTPEVDEVLVARTSFINGGNTIEGAVLVLPRPSSLSRLTHAIGAA